VKFRVKTTWKRNVFRHGNRTEVPKFFRSKVTTDILPSFAMFIRESFETTTAVNELPSWLESGDAQELFLARILLKLGVDYSFSSSSESSESSSEDSNGEQVFPMEDVEEDEYTPFSRVRDIGKEIRIPNACPDHKSKISNCSQFNGIKENINGVLWTVLDEGA
jgi:hypothetical protein